MTQPFEHWTVLPHGKLVQVDENILTVVGKIHMPLMNLPQRMTVVRLVDGRLLQWAEIESLKRILGSPMGHQSTRTRARRCVSLRTHRVEVVRNVPQLRRAWR